jgi:hypothetical protein
MLELFAVPQMIHFHPNVFVQQDGTPPHWGLMVREFMHVTSKLMDSPDITPLVIFLWDYVKGQ